MQARKTSFTLFQNDKTSFQGIKTRTQKSRKIDIFPTFIFQAIQARKMSFAIFQNEKTPFQAIKTRSSKSRKIDLFSTGLTNGFSPKMAVFRTFFFQEIHARKMSFTKLQNEKKPFQAIKTRSQKSRKIDIFPNGLTHAFSPKIAIFQTFIFQEIQAREMSFTIFQNEKTSFQAIKTRSQKSRKIDIFPKGLPMLLVQKWPFFQLLFFRKYRPGKCLLRCCRTKRRLCTL